MPGDGRASHADREQVIDALQAAFVQDRLTKEEFDARIGQTLVARTHAELTAVTADIPAGWAGARPSGKPHRRGNHAVRWGASGLITPAILVAAFAFGFLHGGYGAVAFVIAFAYFTVWLSTGVDMLWEWHCMCSSTAGMCVRCAHTAASHRRPASCVVRLSSVRLWIRCPCTGYVPPGITPEAADAGQERVLDEEFTAVRRVSARR